MASARATAWARVRASGLLKMHLACVLTVSGAIPSDRAMHLLDNPRAII